MVLDPRRLVSRLAVAVALAALLLSAGPGVSSAQAASAAASAASVDDPPIDSDGDGITDDVDACPGEPGLPEYNGCPYTGPGDSDGDGITDDVDACPSEPGTSQYNGCPTPDSDGDGLPDDVDACPTLPGPYDGCPLTDLDGDGVYDDGSDLCPNEPGPADNHGCPYPDTDGDGVPDTTDGCPNTPVGENVDSAGCSLTQLDSDNDGINDEADQCDDTPDGDDIDEHGCTVTTPEPTPVTPKAVVFTDRCGTTQDTYKIPTTTGVAYYRGTKKLTPGTQDVPGAAKVTIRARALDGYALTGTTTWAKKFTSTPCPRGDLTVTSPAVGKVRVTNREDTTLRFKIGSTTRTIKPGETLTLTTTSGRRHWTARWTGLVSPTNGTIRVR